MGEHGPIPSLCLGGDGLGSTAAALRFYSFIAVTGFLDQSKLLEKVVKLSLLHLDTVVVGVLMSHGEEC